jgi:hypothetical protein
MRRRSGQGRILSGALAAALTTIGVLLSAPGALAVSGTPIKAGEPASNDAPSIAVDGSGTAYVAWARVPSSGAETVEYCVIPAGAGACAHSGALQPGETGHSPIIDQVQALVDGTTVVVLAEVYGGEAAYAPVEEWDSTNGGATFTAVNGLKSVGDGVLSADSGAIAAVVMPGGKALGYAWTSVGASSPPGDTPTFDAFSQPATLECSFHACPAEETYAALQPASSPAFLGNADGSVASQQGANAGVLGVFDTLDAPGPCESFGTAYYYGSGEQKTGNSYDVDPGKAGSAWKKGLTPGDCEVESPAVGGGPSGFGVVENDLETRSTVYQAFDQAAGHEDFDTPLVTIDPEEEESQASVSQDGAGGIYVTWLDGGVGTRLAYSGNGGASWVGPATITSDTEEEDLSSSVGADGQGWAAWTEHGSVYVQPFVDTDAVPPATTPIAVTPTPISSPAPVPTPLPTTTTTTQSGAGSSGASITVPQGTAVSDQAHIAGAAVASATGTVTYNLYKDSKCTVAATAGSTASVIAGVAGPSAAVKPSPGTYYWKVSYSGNATNDGSTSACGSEVLVVAVNETHLGLPASNVCLSKRAFLVHPRAPKGVKLVSVEVLINGKLSKKGSLSGHATTVSLVGLPKGTFKVALITKSSKGKTYEEVRTFHTCVAGKHKKK